MRVDGRYDQKPWSIDGRRDPPPRRARGRRRDGLVRPGRRASSATPSRRSASRSQPSSGPPGSQLLERPGGRRPVTPTDAGQRLLRHARRASAAMRAAEADLRRSPTARRARCASARSRASACACCRARCGATSSAGRTSRCGSIEAGYDEELHALLERGELDLAFVIENDDPAFERVRVISDPTSSSPPPARSSRGASGRSGRGRSPRLPLIGYRNADGGGRSRSSARAGSSSRSSFARTRAASSRASSAQGSATRSCRCSGWTRAPTSPCSRWPAIPPRLITIAWHTDRTPTPAARAFVEIVTELGAEIAAGYAQGVTSRATPRARRRR